MAFFKFRKSGDEQSATPTAPMSVEVMRKRAKYRLIGAAVLVLIGVIGFPMLFDKQPRPIAVDTPIEIPDKNKAKPLTIPAPVAQEAAANDSNDANTPMSTSKPAVSVAEKDIIDEKAEPAPAVVAQDAPKTIAKSESKPVIKAVETPAEKAPKQIIKSDEGAKAQALLEGKAVDKKVDATEGRFIVQIGAFADVVKAREARLKLEHAGLKTYTQVVETKDGRRIRVRVGPYAGKDEAEKAALKIKKLDLPAAILTL
jgi:DedD protein